ncbi:MAG: NAD(+)/NADH kinase [Tepidanaerobacteraceae bacterium]|jgi:NAD+ kinase|nr:NAD(+)/NADH kinase [Tepidanaerobacteraceae bacterium]
MKTIGLFPNLSKKNSVRVTNAIISWLHEKGYRVLLPENVSEHLEGTFIRIASNKIFNEIDCAVTLGGDGTLLNLARQLAPYEVPILGINMGHMGFLTEIELPDLYKDLEKFIASKFFIDTRMMLEAQVVRKNRVLERFITLNDAVITKGPFARLIRLKVFSNEAYIDTYPSDGLIVSTPTGSTAYSLSAGGPIINPNMELILLTPICPHTLRSRSIVISKDDIIKIQVIAEHPETMLTVDGQQGYRLLPGDEVIVKRSDYHTRLIRIKKRCFYDILRKKLTEVNFRE